MRAGWIGLLALLMAQGQEPLRVRERIPDARVAEAAKSTPVAVVTAPAKGAGDLAERRVELERATENRHLRVSLGEAGTGKRWRVVMVDKGGLVRLVREFETSEWAEIPGLLRQWESGRTDFVAYCGGSCHGEDGSNTTYAGGIKSLVGISLRRPGMEMITSAQLAGSIVAGWLKERVEALLLFMEGL